MNYEELRPFVLEAIKSKKETQVIELLNLAEQLLVQKGFYKDAQPYGYLGLSTEHRMPPEDREKVREIINDLVIEGILGWGINEHNPAPPFLKVTSYGDAVIKTGEPQPYDPDGYLTYLKKEIPAIDDTIFMYTAESLHAFLRGLMLSSTVMLGAASEKAFLLLLESYTNAISDPVRKTSFEGRTKGAIKRKFDEFKKDLPVVRKNLPRPLEDDLDTQLEGVFNLIRTTRNDVGHPTGRKIERRLAFANLQLFVPYCKRIYDLIDWFNKNKV